MPVVREGDHHLRPRAQELAVELAHRLGVVEHDLRDERAGLEVAAPLELEQVALGAQDGVLRESFTKSVHSRRA